MENAVGLLIPLTFVAMLVLERLVPARPLPRVPGWNLKGTLSFLVNGTLSGLVPAAVAAAFGGRLSLGLGRIGLVPSVLVLVVLGDLLGYWIHRTLHRVPLLWRWTHQMHHSAERVDMMGAAYFHPLDTVVNSGLAALLVVPMGVSPAAAALAGYVTFVYSTFQHLNMRTPRWLGYVIQRPEAHSVHHQRGVHAYNYGNIPLWDVLFGTFRNPADFTGPAGFWDGASGEVGAMLLGRDVSEPRANRGEMGAVAPTAAPPSLRA